MTDTVTTSSTLSGLIQTAFDRLLYFALRSQPQFDTVADVKPSLVTNPGTTVTFEFFNDLAPITTTLDESTDVDRVALGSSTKTVTIGEYGNAVGLTAKLRSTSLIDVDEGAANVLSYNVVDSIDLVARAPLDAGTNVRYATGTHASRATLTPADLFGAADVRYVVAKLRGNKAVPRKNGYYMAFIHPDVAHDLKANTAAGQWREAHVYASPEAIYANEIGAFEGAIFIETPRAEIVTDAGSSPATSDVYITPFVGQEVLAKATAIEPHLVQSPVTDRLRRFPSWGWYALLGYARFREGALYRVESTSSIGAN